MSTEKINFEHIGGSSIIDDLLSIYYKLIYLFYLNMETNNFISLFRAPMYSVFKYYKIYKLSSNYFIFKI